MLSKTLDLLLQTPTLTPTHSAAWGGHRDEQNTGHVANGRRVMSDARDVTRHIIAGLATALGGARCRRCPDTTAQRLRLPACLPPLSYADLPPMAHGQIGPPTLLPLPPQPSGVVPPYSRPLRGGAPSGSTPEQDWRWGVGATPYGPYSNFSGVSEIATNAARRNLLLGHVAAALREGQGRLDEFDAFVEDHLQGPWAAAGIGADRVDGRRHFLDTVAG